MFTINNVVQPETLKEAYEILVSKKNNTMLGGCAFLKLSNKRIETGVDLSSLDLSYIKEDENFIEIGASTTLREIETSSLLNSYFNGILRESVKNIIGIQLRNIATAGATVFSKYGFSDFNTALLSLDAEVELYKGGRMLFEEFLSKSYEKDILSKIYIKKKGRIAVYTSFRNSSSDYPILNAAVSCLDDNWRIVLGARPQGAKIADKASALLLNKELDEKLIDEAAGIASEELTYGSNMRATEEYRRALSKVLVKRTVKEVLQCR
ncbi:carbon monoxide dehydrogenase medium chain [Oxobacter pfennigii]|uniref:Carbon monoxide dehydrogenase medium chain n=1 Tax=Oxobacter pfennigii TaxID=36849 RepID=A0A0P8WDT7_9CLOT|nr:FAD binding domain-containing protein [Oxobacter pfennigii]KPU46193.1 carbon monoxide dehydrogenase medium chain [Oxobacter pfennigii]